MLVCCLSGDSGQILRLCWSCVGRHSHDHLLAAQERVPDELSRAEGDLIARHLAGRWRLWSGGEMEMVVCRCRRRRHSFNSEVDGVVRAEVLALI